MVHAQIVCRYITEELLRKTLGSFRPTISLKARTGHVLVELRNSDPVSKILSACRRDSFAYIRLIAWEKGGGLETTGDATCVAGSEGQPLRPIAVTLSSERVNQEHALFKSRVGLIVANVRRRADKTTVSVEVRRIHHIDVAPTESIINDTFECPSQEWLTDVQTRVEMDKYVPVIRAVLRKAECVFCVHCHYREVEERKES